MTMTIVCVIASFIIGGLFGAGIMALMQAGGADDDHAPY